MFLFSFPVPRMAAAGVKRIENLVVGAQLQHRLEHPQQPPQHGEGQGDSIVFPRPTVANRFKILQKIGSGGFGAIYKGPQT